MGYQNEQQVADRAVQMLEASLRSKVSSFKDHVSRADNSASLKDVTTKASVKNMDPEEMEIKIFL